MVNLLLVRFQFLERKFLIYDLNRLELDRQGREHSRRSHTLASTGPYVLPCRTKSVGPTEIQTQGIICVAIFDRPQTHEIYFI